VFRFLYVDSDLEAVQASLRGTPEVALSRNEVQHLPLQPVGNYRRRMLDHLNEWLPREKLYAVPRSLQTQGCRALGRLAFVDKYNSFLARLRREVQHATKPDTLYQAVTQTGLALRDGVPRVYVLAAAGGGSSGCLVDLGYVLRRELQQLRHPEAEVIALLFCGAPADPATPRSEQANVYATLTELNHFTDPAVPFAAQYGVEGPRLVEQGQPFTATYVLQLAHRSPESLRDLVAHLGSYLFHELTTPLGLRLDRSRHLPVPVGSAPFRSFGTYAVWFPRGLLLRLAARQACRFLFEDWQGVGQPTATAEVEAACARVLADSELRPEAVCARIEELARSAFDGPPAAALTGVLASLEEQSQQSVAQEDPGNWSRQALVRIREWVGIAHEIGLGGAGNSSPGSDWRKSRLGRGLTTAAERLAGDWNQQLAQAAWGLMAHPGKRVAAAEVALARFMQFCEEAAGSQLVRLQQMASRTEQAWQNLETALADCLAGPGGFSFFGNRAQRSLRLFMDRLAAFARQRLTEEVVGAGQHFYLFLHGQLADRLREMSFCRQRVRHLQESLDATPDLQEESNPARLASGLTPGNSPMPSAEAFWESIRQSATARVVLPEDEPDLERAATRFLKRLTREQWTQLDQSLQDRVLGLLGGLHSACTTSGDLVRIVTLPLLDQAASFLGEHLPATDVAQFELAAAEKLGQSVGTQAQSYFTRATPLVASKDGSGRESFLLIPAGDAGKAYGEASRQAMAGLQMVRAPGQAHLMFCQEQGYLSAEDLQNFLRPCRAAYDDTVTVPQASPHARFDILDWLPLDP
jgi:hypothetical protein